MTAAPTPAWRRLHDEATVVDLHAHPALKATLFRRSLRHRLGPVSTRFSPFSLRTSFANLVDGGVDVLLSAVYVPEAPLLAHIPLLRLFRLLQPAAWREFIRPSYFQATVNAIAEMERQVAAHGRRRRPGARAVQVARTPAALEACLATRALAVVHCLEGAHGLHGAAAGKGTTPRATADVEAEVLANLAQLQARGVAYITLAHFYPNQVAAPCFPFPEELLPLARWRRVLAEHDLTRGLTPLGETVVARMLDLGILIDVTHCTPAARARVYELVDARGARERVLATHVGAQAINPSPYNLADWEIRWLADHGGVAGVIFMNYWLMPHETRLGLNFIARTLEHFVQVGGVEVAAFGSDLDGFTDPPDEIVDAAQLPRLTQRLVAERGPGGARRYDEAAIAGILGGNALRLLRQGWGRPA